MSNTNPMCGCLFTWIVTHQKYLVSWQMYEIWMQLFRINNTVFRSGLAAFQFCVTTNNQGVVHACYNAKTRWSQIEYKFSTKTVAFVRKSSCKIFFLVNGQMNESSIWNFSTFFHCKTYKNMMRFERTTHDRVDCTRLEVNDILFFLSLTDSRYNVHLDFRSWETFY